MSKKSDDLLNGMKEIRGYLSRSEATILKWHREYDLPIKKIGVNGVWVASRKKLDTWAAKQVK